MGTQNINMLRQNRFLNDHELEPDLQLLVTHHRFDSSKEKKKLSYRWKLEQGNMVIIAWSFSSIALSIRIPIYAILAADFAINENTLRCNICIRQFSENWLSVPVHKYTFMLVEGYFIYICIYIFCLSSIRIRYKFTFGTTLQVGSIHERCTILI